MFRNASEVWAANLAGRLDDDQAQQLALQLMPAPRQAIAKPLAVAAKRYWIDRSPDQRSPDRVASRRRARMHAASGAMPPHLAAEFTPKEQAVLRIVADEFVAHGVCDQGHNERSARAGGCKSTARNALRKAESLGLVEIERRPRSGRKHLPNLVRIISREWLVWLTRGPTRKEQAAARCARAKPLLRPAPSRVLREYPPRVPDLKTSSSDPVDKFGEKVNRTGASRA